MVSSFLSFGTGFAFCDSEDNGTATQKGTLMTHSRKPLLILVFSLLFTGISVENALAHCLFSDLTLGNAVSQWISLVIMSAMTAGVFYLKFIYPRQPVPARNAGVDGADDNARSVTKELKIGDSFSSWVRLNRIGENR